MNLSSHAVSPFMDLPASSPVSTTLERITPVELGRGFTHYLRHSTNIILFSRSNTDVTAHICSTESSVLAECSRFLKDHYETFLRQMSLPSLKQLSFTIKGENNYTYPIVFTSKRQVK